MLSYAEKTARLPLKINLPIKILCLLIRVRLELKFKVEYCRIMIRVWYPWKSFCIYFVFVILNHLDLECAVNSII